MPKIPRQSNQIKGKIKATIIRRRNKVRSLQLEVRIKGHSESGDDGCLSSYSLVQAGAEL